VKKETHVNFLTDALDRGLALRSANVMVYFTGISPLVELGLGLLR